MTYVIAPPIPFHQKASLAIDGITMQCLQLDNCRLPKIKQNHKYFLGLWSFVVVSWSFVVVSWSFPGRLQVVCGRLLVVCGRLWSFPGRLWSFVVVSCYSNYGNGGFYLKLVYYGT